MTPIATHSSHFLTKIINFENQHKMKKTIITIFAAVLSVAICAASENSEASSAERFDRGIGISSATFIPKGTIAFGATFSYNTYDVGNAADDLGFSTLFGMVNKISGNLVTGSVSPHVSYFIMDNLAVGGRFDFNRTKLDVGNASLSLTDDMSFGINDFHYLKDLYSGAVFARYFIPFGESKRFAMFTELRATGGYGQAETYKLTDLDKNGTYQDIYDFQIGIIPGLAAFVTNEVALEVSVGLVGLDYQKVVQHTNNLGTSVMERSGANFKVNLLQINLGITCYLPEVIGKNKKGSKK